MANYNTLRRIAAENKYKIDYDDKTKEVKLFNPTNKATINFMSGQGADYGIGEFKDGQHYVTDYKKLKGLAGKRVDEFMKIKGIKEAKIIKIATAFEIAKRIYFT